MSFIGLILAVTGVISLFFLQTTIMQVNQNGDSSTGYLSVGRTYRITGVPIYSEGFYCCEATICLYLDSEEIFRRTLDFEEMEQENPVTLVSFDSFQVDQSGVYTLMSIETQVGEIAIQESQIQSLLGIDDLTFIIVGFVIMGVGVVLYAIFQRRDRFSSIEEYKYE